MRSHGDPGCLPGSADGGAGVAIDPNYHTPYSLTLSGGVQYQWHKIWTLSAVCPTPACSVPITNPNQLLVSAGALGDFFGPGTTVGIPFAAQLGVRMTF